MEGHSPIAHVEFTTLPSALKLMFQSSHLKKKINKRQVNPCWVLWASQVKTKAERDNLPRKRWQAAVGTSQHSPVYPEGYRSKCLRVVTPKWRRAQFTSSCTDLCLTTQTKPKETPAPQKHVQQEQQRWQKPGDIVRLAGPFFIV
jgi:hypothetical protein